MTVTRILSGVLAIMGAVMIGLGSWLPYSERNDFKLRIFEQKEPHAILFFAAEPAAVVIAAAVLGTLLLFRPAYRLTAGVLLGCGVQVSLMFVGYVGYNITSDFGGDTQVGGWIGIAGGLVCAAAGLILLLASDKQPASAAVTPAGWYADPTVPGMLRYWSGAGWTDHTNRCILPDRRQRRQPPQPLSRHDGPGPIWQVLAFLSNPCATTSAPS